MSEGKDTAGVRKLRKLTIRDIGAQPDVRALLAFEEKHGKGAEMALAQIVGAITASQPGETEKGPYVKFFGRFEGTNLRTGEVFQSPSCILPNFIGEELHGALRLAQSKGEGVVVEFACRIGAYFDETAATKYVYTVEHLRDPNAVDPLEAVRARFGLKALPAPKDEDKKKR